MRGLAYWLPALGPHDIAGQATAPGPYRLNDVAPARNSGVHVARVPVDVRDAVQGVEMIIVPYTADAQGVRDTGPGQWMREGREPFVPAACLERADDREQFIDLFRQIAAVWHVRLGTHALSRMMPNPNADRPAPRELLDNLIAPDEAASIRC